ncbi:hypothetical protein OQJ26_08520 [Legionella sp. PATHC038]|uniref:hypothetical protein n=1 Tax=Legionella sheltonii TaxID=2992041 RepID=UPI002244EDB5|nr:hypothetical protein [Legionella sp. PATHC038]MCW8398833.1 hypothetical protein [Legionella sp. PATHC038]
MEIDEELTLESDEEEEPQRESEVALYTYLEANEIQFIPYEFHDETNAVDLVIDSREQDHQDPVIWYCSSRLKSLKQLNMDWASTMAAVALFDNKEFWMESAVAAGRCTRLLLGEMQPEMHVCKGETISEVTGMSRIYRLSKEIPGFRTWNSFWQNSRIFPLKKPIVGLTAVFLINYFLANIDMNNDNYGVVELEDYWQAVSIDPECCFSYEFYTEQKSKIHSYIQRLPDMLPDGLFNQQELFDTLEKIISTPLSAYQKIFDESFSPTYKRQKELYLSVMGVRIQRFKEVYGEILEEPVKHYKKLEETFNCSRAQQRANQNFLEAICDYKPQPQSFFSNNPYVFYYSKTQDEQATKQPTPSNRGW